MKEQTMIFFWKTWKRKEKKTLGNSVRSLKLQSFSYLKQPSNTTSSVDLTTPPGALSRCVAPWPSCPPRLCPRPSPRACARSQCCGCRRSSRSRHSGTCWLPFLWIGCSFMLILLQTNCLVNNIIHNLQTICWFCYQLEMYKQSIEVQFWNCLLDMKTYFNNFKHMKTKVWKLKHIGRVARARCWRPQPSHRFHCRVHLYLKKNKNRVEKNEENMENPWMIQDLYWKKKKKKKDSPHVFSDQGFFSPSHWVPHSVNVRTWASPGICCWPPSGKHVSWGRPLRAPGIPCRPTAHRSCPPADSRSGTCPGRS